jgi:cation-transporting P-type ATPase F
MGSKKRDASEDLVQLVEPWHALAVNDVEQKLDTRSTGLSGEEAERRLELFGPNEISDDEGITALQVLLHQFTSPLIAILIVAALVTLAIGEYIDSAVIAAVLVLNAIIGFTQEYRAEQSARKLKQMVAPEADVMRDGEVRRIPSRQLVPGDLVVLESGDRIPADLRLIHARTLQVEEAALSGESVPAQKRVEPVEPQSVLADRLSLAFAGTAVTSGRARGYVVGTGLATELGKIAEHVRTEAQELTPLQRRMNRLAVLIGLIVAAAATAAFAIGLAMGESASQMLLVAVALAVASIPEGLPIVFTITLAIGVRRMAARNAVVRRLPAVEALGSTTVVGSDKTGTLTMNRMTVEAIWTAPDGVVPIDRPVEAVSRDTAIGMTLLAGVLANEARLRDVEGLTEAEGDPTETALLMSAITLGIDQREERGLREEVAEIPFESDLQYSASFRRIDGETVAYLKGAPEKLLEMCAGMLGPEGPEPLDQDRVRHATRELAAAGLRVLGMAYGHVDDQSFDPDRPLLPDHLILTGLQAMKDPPREGVGEAIRGCREAGIRVLMITGDHASTAQAIAKELGLATDDSPVLTGVELEEMPQDHLRREVGRVSVYARVSPEHKLRIVQALKEEGEVVGVTGDGVNDAPALKSADIGIAMGRSGTDVAREASDIVLADDNFASIYAAVEEGRVTFDNLRKATFFLISTGAASIVLILTAQLLGWPLPMLPAQLLWLNLVTNGLQDVAIAFEPGEPGVTKRPPRPPSEGIVSRLLWRRTAMAGIVMGLGTLGMFWWDLQVTGNLTHAQTVALTTMVLFQAFHVGNIRSEHRSVFRVPIASNPFLLGAVVLALVLHISALHLPFLQFVLRVSPLESHVWGWMILVATSIVALIEIDKWILRRRHPDP